MLPLSKKIIYSFGMLGWSVMSNIIGVMLIYFYIPPEGAGLSNLIPQIALWGVFNIMSLIVAGGRLFDAFIDPVVAFYSDKSKNPKGRRIPFMKLGIIPSVICCVLLFYPFRQEEAMINAGWLLFIQVLFYFFLTLYIIPYNALLPELAADSEEKVKLSTITSFAFVVGMIISSQTPAIADVIQRVVDLESRQLSLQLAIAVLSIFAGICMFIPVLFIDEKKYARAYQPVSIPMFSALKQTFKNSSFRFFLVADFMYFISVTIITGGLLYYVKTLAGMEEAEGGKLMILMVGLSLLLYPFITVITRKWGKKKLILLSLAMLAVLFLGIYFIGSFPGSSSLQLYILFSVCSVPLTFLSIIPPALLAELADADLKATGQAKEGLYYAVRYFFVKLGQTMGIMLFAILLKYGKDPGDDFGLRLTGIVGCVLCLLGFFIFMKFRETKN